jgi:hypothetical protein
MARRVDEFSLAAHHGEMVQQGDHQLVDPVLLCRLVIIDECDPVGAQLERLVDREVTGTGDTALWQEEIMNREGASLLNRLTVSRPPLPGSLSTTTSETAISSGMICAASDSRQRASMIGR